MNKIVLLLGLKNKILYRRVLDKLIVLLMIVFITGLMLVYWHSSNNTIRVYIANEDDSSLIDGFLKSSSRQVEIFEVSREEGLNKVKNYQGELLIVIPQNAGNRIRERKTKNIFELYYLKGNQLSELLSDRLIADAFSEIYNIVGEAFTEDLFQRYEINNSNNKVNEFRQNVLRLRSKIINEQYFKLLNQLDLNANNETTLNHFKDNSSSTSAMNIIEFGILIVVSGINIVFLLYFGLKLLYQSDKDVRIRLSGFSKWHILVSNILVMLIPQLVLFLILIPVSVYYGNIMFVINLAIISMIGILFNVILISLIKEKKLYFPMGIGIYLIGVIISIVFLQN